MFVPYCSGDLHAGTRTASAETFGLHFAGHLIVKALIAQLSTDYGLGSAELVVFAGDSAGGMGVFYNVDYVAAQLPGVRVIGMPIGGYIFAHPNYVGPDASADDETAQLSDFKHNAELFHAYYGDGCPAAVGNDSAWQCFIPTVLYPYVRTPLLVLEAQTDSVVMFGFSDAPQQDTPEVRAYVSAFRVNATAAARVVASSTKDGIFSPNCLMHCGFARGSPMVRGMDYYAALRTAAGPQGPSAISLVDDCTDLQCSQNCPPVPIVIAL